MYRPGDFVVHLAACTERGEMNCAMQLKTFVDTYELKIS